MAVIITMHSPLQGRICGIDASDETQRRCCDSTSMVLLDIVYGDEDPQVALVPGVRPSLWRLLQGRSGRKCQIIRSALFYASHDSARISMQPANIDFVQVGKVL